MNKLRYYILKCAHLENFSHQINNFHQNIKFTMEEEGNGELVLIDTSLKRNDWKSRHWKSTLTYQYLHYISQLHTNFKENVASSLFNRAYSVFANKDKLIKENVGMKQVFKENGYQESIISKMFKRITNNHSLS